MSPDARHSLDGMRSGQHGLWTTSTRRRKCISPVIVDTVPSAAGRTKIKSPFAPHLPRLGSASAVLISRCCLLGTRHSFLSIGLPKFTLIHDAIVHMARAPCGRICMAPLQTLCVCLKTLELRKRLQCIGGDYQLSHFIDFFSLVSYPELGS